MSDIPYLPLYVNDYEGDTAHLNIEEDGAYSRLIRLCWRTSGCSIPNDPKWICRHMRINLVTYESLVKPIIVEYFTIKKGRVFQKRLQKEFEQISAKLKAQKVNGKKGGDTKALNKKKKASSQSKVSLLAKSYQPEPELEPELDIKKTKAKKGSRIPDDWCISDKLINWAIKKGFDRASIQNQVEKFKLYWESKSGQAANKVDWDKTFQSWMMSDYNKPKEVNTAW